MESLIFLLVLLIIIIANIAKMKKKLKESAPSGQKMQGGWKQNLKDMLAEMQKEARTSPQQGQESVSEGRRPSAWEDLMPPEVSAEDKQEKPGPPPEARAPAAQEPGPAARGRTLIESRSRQGQTPESRIGKTERRAPAPPVEKPASGHRLQRRTMRISGQDLRRGIIWYEILGPPMSLRDPEREMWL